MHPAGERGGKRRVLRARPRRTRRPRSALVGRRGRRRPRRGARPGRRGARARRGSAALHRCATRRRARSAIAGCAAASRRDRAVRAARGGDEHERGRGRASPASRVLDDAPSTSIVSGATTPTRSPLRAALRRGRRSTAWSAHAAARREPARSTRSEEPHRTACRRTEDGAGRAARPVRDRAPASYLTRAGCP